MVSGMVSFGVSQSPLFNIEGFGTNGLSNPLANASGAYISAAILHGDPSEAWKNAFWSATLTNVGQMSLNYANYKYGGGRTTQVPQHGIYRFNRMLDIWRPAAIGLQVLGMGHSGLYNADTGQTKELIRNDSGQKDVREYLWGESKNSVYRFGNSFGTSYEQQLNVNYSSVPTPGTTGIYHLLSDNCNAWTNQHTR